jgi:hypothetical protein
VVKKKSFGIGRYIGFPQVNRPHATSFNDKRAPLTSTTKHSTGRKSIRLVRPKVVNGPYNLQPTERVIFFYPTPQAKPSPPPLAPNTSPIQIPPPRAAAAAMPFTPGPYSGVSTLALVSPFCGLGFGSFQNIFALAMRPDRI